MLRRHLPDTTVQFRDNRTRGKGMGYDDTVRLPRGGVTETMKRRTHCSECRRLGVNAEYA